MDLPSAGDGYYRTQGRNHQSPILTLAVDFQRNTDRGGQHHLLGSLHAVCLPWIVSQRCYRQVHVLKNEEREVIILSYIEEMSHKDISNVINMPIGTVKTHIKRGREKLVKYLKFTDHGLSVKWNKWNQAGLVSKQFPKCNITFIGRMQKSLSPVRPIG